MRKFATGRVTLGGLCLLLAFSLAALEAPLHRHKSVSHQAAARKSKAAAAAVTLAIAQRQLASLKFADAAKEAAAAAKRAPLLRDYSEYIRAEAEYQLKNYTEVAKGVTQVFKELPISPLTGPAAALLVQADLDGNRPRDALRLIEKYFKRIPQPQGDLLLAKCFAAIGDLPQAAEYDQRVYYNFPTSPEASDAANALADLKQRLGRLYPPVMPTAMLRRAQKLFQANRPDDARVELQAAIPQLGGKQRDLAEVRLGEADFLAGHTRASFDYLTALKVDDPEADAERLHFLIRCARRLDSHADVRPYLTLLKQKYPSSPWRLQSLISVADEARVDNDPKTFLPLYRSCAATFEDDPRSGWCHWRLAFYSYRHNAGDSYDLLRRQIEEYPRAPIADDALYFLGRLSERKGDSSSARACYDLLLARFPNTYFAVLARERLKDKAIASADPSPEMLGFLKSVRWPPRPEFPSFTPGRIAARRIARAHLLSLAGLDDLASGELQFGAHEDDDQRNVYAYELARMAAAEEKPAQAMQAIQSLTPRYLYMPLDEAPVSFWKLAFPLPYRTSIEIHSRREELNPFLVAALIRQESEFNAHALSPAHAYGLMQIRPSTGRALARHLGWRHFYTRYLLDGDRNIELGTYFFRQLYKTYNGDLDLALAAYNAGPSRANLWCTWGPFREPAEFIETVPFHETRTYIELVLRNADVYRRLYEKPKPEVPAYHRKPAPKWSRKHTRSRVGTG